MTESNFSKLGLSASTLQALAIKGFEEPTLTQEKIIPLLMQGNRDIIGQAQTGTGKTAAFGLPLIEKLKPNAKDVQALILVPTRELAIQVAEEINSLKGKKDLQIFPIYGGQSISEQLRRLKKGVDIVVGTPGRVMDHLERKSLQLNHLEFVVLDEADEMLNMGFVDDIEKILKSVNPDKRMLLFSATMPSAILNVAEKYMKNKEIVKVVQQQLSAPLTDQIYFEVSAENKFEALCRIIDVESDFYAVIFCRTKVEVENIAAKLKERSYTAEGLHGDITQHNREKILSKFKSRKINILVATDVAARGIDVNNLTHVINYSLPQNPESYVHRVGRTGRAGKEGTAITFITPDEYRKLSFIKRITKLEIRKEKLPKVQDVIKLKISRIKANLKEIIANQEHSEYEKLTDSLLEIADPNEVISALLKFAFQTELHESGYKEIKESREVSVDNKGRTRLFVALGKRDNMTKGKLANLVEKQAHLHQDKIKNIEIFDNFSFITVSFNDAEIILQAFKQNRRGSRPIIERAKPPKQ